MSAEEAQRSRTAKRAEKSSDVTRLRGIALGAIAAGVLAFGIAFSSIGADALRSPGPLSQPHEARGIECASCHDRPQIASACTGCHARASIRPGHRALASSGALACTSCHRAHDSRSLVFAPDGSVSFARGGTSERVEIANAYHPRAAVRVPMISTEACGTCHDARAPRDPLALCAHAGYSLCFDEHRAIGTARDGAWEAAREAAPHLRVGAVEQGSNTGPFLWVFGAALAGLAIFVAVRAIRTRKKARPARAVAMPSVVDKVRLPQIDTNTCLGCYACVDACPYDVLAVERFVAIVVRPKDCCGLTLCEQVCPNGSLVIREEGAIEDRPNVSETLESIDTPGVWIAGDLTGAPLIRNAIQQGALAVRTIAERYGVSRSGDLDLAIVGAGPAGISAALEAKARGLRFEVLEQASVAESIRSFPRGKLVFDQPVTMPLAGDLWLEQSTKEELLAKWMRIVRKEQLPIRERHRVTAVERRDVFVVRASDPNGYEVALRAKRVLLALGRRGTPRKLEAEVPDEAIDRVHYSLADARSHVGARAIVVGLGDVAMETAIALARQPDTLVTLVHRGDSFARGKVRNVSEVQRLVREGRIDLRLSTEVRAISRERVALWSAAGESTVGYDALFVMVGSLPPWPFLEAAGVHRVKSPG